MQWHGYLRVLGLYRPKRVILLCPYLMVQATLRVPERPDMSGATEATKQATLWVFLFYIIGQCGGKLYEHTARMELPTCGTLADMVLEDRGGVQIAVIPSINI